MPNQVGGVARQGGGFRPSFGQLGEEHLDENATSQAMAQKQASQQLGNSAQSTTGGNALKSLGSKQQGGSQPGQAKQSTPRSVDSIPGEIKNFVGDVGKELKNFFDLNALLEINTADTPEQQAKKRQISQRFNRLTQEQQQIAQQQYQTEMKKKQQEEQEKQAKKQREEQMKAQSIALPSSPKKGPVGPGGKNKKTDAAAMLSQQRKASLSKVSSAG